METKEVDSIEKIKYVSAWIRSKRLGAMIFIYSVMKKSSLEKAYDILINNPQITAEEYLIKMDMVSIAQETKQEGLIQGEEFDDIDEMEEIDDMEEE